MNVSEEARVKTAPTAKDGLTFPRSAVKNRAYRGEWIIKEVSEKRG